MADDPAETDLATTLMTLFDNLSEEQRANPQMLYRELREWIPALRGDFGVVVSRYDDVRRVLLEPEVFSSGVNAFTVGNQRPMIPIQVDPPLHRKYRQLLEPHFSPARVVELEAETRKSAADLVDAIAVQTGCEFFAEFAVPFPCGVFLRTFGFPEGSLAALMAYKDGIIRPEGADREEIDNVRSRAAEGIYGIVDAALGGGAGAGTVIASLREAEMDGQRLSGDEVRDIAFTFVLAGLDTVTALLSCAVHFLAMNPERRKWVVADPRRWPDAIEEVLRWESPVAGVPRKAARDDEIAGEKISRGEVVFALLGAANTDGGEFVDPEVIDLGRSPNRHLAFGGGVHRCIGSHLARMEMRVALEEWHRRFPDYRIPEGSEPRWSRMVRAVEYLPLEFGS